MLQQSQAKPTTAHNNKKIATPTKITTSTIQNQKYVIPSIDAPIRDAFFFHHHHFGCSCFALKNPSHTADAGLGLLSLVCMPMNAQMRARSLSGGRSRATSRSESVVAK